MIKSLLATICAIIVFSIFIYFDGSKFSNGWFSCMTYFVCLNLYDEFKIKNYE